VKGLFPSSLSSQTVRKVDTRFSHLLQVQECSARREKSEGPSKLIKWDYGKGTEGVYVQPSSMVLVVGKIIPWGGGDRSARFMDT
jgi:hypothetical protein